MQPSDPRRLAPLVPLIMALATGCGSGAAASHKGVAHLKAITVLYFKANSLLHKNPETEAEFKKVIADSKPDLGVLGASNIDDLFVSDRDNQPLVIMYGQAPKGVAAGVVAYEQTGVDGKRLVGNRGGQVEEADATRFAQLVPSPSS
jgi:hypothetical protein